MRPRSLAPLLAVALAQAGCLFPEYTFDLPAGGADASISDGATSDRATDARADASLDSPADAKADAIADATSEFVVTPEDSGTENCTNGKDDDSDGKADCADPKCGAHVCVEAAPSGFLGPVVFYDGLASQTVPNCDGAFPAKVFDAHDQLVADALSCSACSCAAPTGLVCGGAKPEFFEKAGCASGCSWTSTNEMQANGCYTIGFDFGGTTQCTTGPTALTVPSVTASAGSCAPSPATQPKATYSWGEEGRACGQVAPIVTGGCPGSQVCAPKAFGAFAKVCVVHQGGDVDCPATSYTDKHLLYAGADDSRACSPCACDSPACTGSVQVFQQSGCTTVTQTVPLGVSSCAAIRAASVVSAGKSEEYVRYVPDGHCAATGGQATGDVSPSQPVTICCVP